VDLNWGAVLTIAATLLKEKELTGAKVKRLIEGGGTQATRAIPRTLHRSLVWGSERWESRKREPQRRGKEL
jgi:hypothetical protein